MPDKSGRMTYQERVFVEQYARTGDAVYSAAKAGYKHPRASASQNLAKPTIQARVEKVRDYLRSTGLEIGVSVLVELAQDRTGKTPATVRRAAASDLVKHGKGEIVGILDKEPHEMSGEELARAIERLDILEEEKMKRAKPVSGGVFA